MVVDALLDLTHRDEIVLEPFLGSGSTLIAAEKTGRLCCGIEIDALYVDLVVRRYEKISGKTAVIEQTGETFYALALRRRQKLGPATLDTPSTDTSTAESKADGPVFRKRRRLPASA